VRYQNSHLNVLNPTMYHTWRCGSGNTRNTPNNIKNNVKNACFVALFCFKVKTGMGHIYIRNHNKKN
jgi:hypothetical protein